MFTILLCLVPAMLGSYLWFLTNAKVSSRHIGSSFSCSHTNQGIRLFENPDTIWPSLQLPTKWGVMVFPGDMHNKLFVEVRIRDRDPQGMHLTGRYTTVHPMNFSAQWNHYLPSFLMARTRTAVFDFVCLTW